MANVERINQIIGEIEQDVAAHFAMDDYYQYLDWENDRRPERGYVECGTAFCIAGYANFFRLREEGVDLKKLSHERFMREIISESKATDWLGINRCEAAELFNMVSSPISRSEFDKHSPEARIAIVKAVFMNLIETGKVDWRQALIDSGAISTRTGFISQ